jgi:arylsulfatase A-like enzyme
LAALAERPNVIVIMSDDQGVGDYGFMGNTVIQPPALGAMHARSGFLSNFYVSSVCAPTRASLVTGRYNYRTRCIDTYIGRAMMETEEVTITEFLRNAGYRTGIYGKWHMGYNYPLRAMDQGFEDSLVHRGGGIGQPSDPIGAEGKYTDPVLIKNGEEVAMKGYGTDIYFDAAMDFIGQQKAAGKSFFTYIPANAPHGPFHDVPKELFEMYKKVDFSPIIIGKQKPARLAATNDELARIAAMITNIDQNVGRLFKKLDELQLSDNTIVIYLNDNGPNTMRYVGDMRGMKSHVDDGGIRSPLLFHWPAKVKAGNRSDSLCAHIDVLPTLLEACGVAVPANHKLDGRSFLPLLTDGSTSWPERSVVFQTHRGDAPQLYHHFALHQPPWKLVHPSGFGRERFEGEPKLQLYNLREDPRQQKDVAAEQPETFKRLKEAYEAWFADVSSTRPDNYAPPRIFIGTAHEPRSVLTRQDWRHSDGRPWAPDSNGAWLLEAPEAGDYQIELILRGDHPAGSATITAGSVKKTLPLVAKKTRSHIAHMALPAGKMSLRVDLTFGKKVQGPHQVILTRKSVPTALASQIDQRKESLG